MSEQLFVCPFAMVRHGLKTSQYQPLCLIFLQHALHSLNEAVSEGKKAIGKQVQVVDAINSMKSCCHVNLKMKSQSHSGVTPNTLLTASADLGVFTSESALRSASNLSMIIELKKPLDSLLHT
ncbi:hypothetical protein EON65_46880 [archaeon]|nr:MAG: hypothetical protein EON65_46880 [archaeon]